MRYLISSDAFITYEIDASSPGEALALARTWNRDHPTLTVEHYPHIQLYVSDKPEIESEDDDAEAPPRLRLIELSPSRDPEQTP